MAVLPFTTSPESRTPSAKPSASASTSVVVYRMILAPPVLLGARVDKGVVGESLSNHTGGFSAFSSSMVSRAVHRCLRFSDSVALMIPAGSSTSPRRSALGDTRTLPLTSSRCENSIWRRRISACNVALAADTLAVSLGSSSTARTDSELDTPTKPKPIWSILT
eukprot:scaffold1596_cov302-Pinguiococcus_pyrenoidosus.AAC.57